MRDDDLAPTHGQASAQPRRSAEGAKAGHDRWVVNKLRALGAYYTKGIDEGAEFRSALNTTSSLEELRALIRQFFKLEDW
jgi:hypothetical protein